MRFDLCSNLAKPFTIRRRIAAILGVAASLVGLPAAGQSWQYIYDEAGRLRATISSSGTRAEYDYDAAGNLLAIRTPASGALTLSGFSPKSGAAGTVVTIIGAGFSTTVASNVVKFNGVAATVTAATATQLTVTAPSATTGPISVTVGTTTKTTTDSFTYSAVPTAAPTVTSVTPLCVNPGATLTIAGTNFDATAGATRAELNVSVLPTTAVTATSVTARVSGVTTTGPVRIVTARGIATSSQYVTVLPTGLSCATNYDATTILQPGGPAATVSTTSAVKRAVVAIPLTGGDYASLDFNSFTLNPPSSATSAQSLSYTVIEPGGAQIASGTLSEAVRAIMLPVAARTGVYSVILNNPAGTFTGSGQVRRATALTPDGAAWAITSVPGGLMPRATFQANAGDKFGLAVTNFTPPNTSDTLIADIVGPDGAKVGTVGANTRDNYSTTNVTTPIAGTYEIRALSPAATTSANIWVSRDAASPVTPNTPLATSISRAGQNRPYTFTGQVGESYSVALTNVAMAAPYATQGMVATVLDPNGGVYGSTMAPSSASLPLQIGPIRNAGTHTVFVEAVDPGTGALSTATGTGTVVLSRAANVSLTINGAGQTANATLAGQVMTATFPGVAGEHLGVAITDIVLQPATNTSVDAYLVLPDGTSSFAGTASVSAGGIAFKVDPATTGTYTLRVTPRAGMTSMSARFWASRDTTPTLAPNVQSTLTVPRPGANIRAGFTATSGQTFNLIFNNGSSTPASQAFRVEVYAANGNLIGVGDIGAYAFTQTLELSAVPVAGPVMVYVRGSPNSSAAFTGSIGVTLTPR